MDANGRGLVEQVTGRVIGIDPGLHITGYAVVEPAPEGPFVVEAGVIRPRCPKGSLGRRLDWIHRGVTDILEQHPAGSMALEQLHSHVSFPRTAILMAHARGAIVLAAAQRGTPVFGYAATRIKKTLTGSGRAPKSQVQHAIMTELGLDQPPEPFDVADACAVALCHFYISRNRRKIEES